jgi:hypothetical protein
MFWLSCSLGSIRKNKLDDELDPELQVPIEMQTAKLIAQGPLQVGNRK